jgi:hypothetical protein
LASVLEPQHLGRTAGARPSTSTACSAGWEYPRADVREVRGVAGGGEPPQSSFGVPCIRISRAAAENVAAHRFDLLGEAQRLPSDGPAAQNLTIGFTLTGFEWRVRAFFLALPVTSRRALVSGAGRGATTCSSRCVASRAGSTSGTGTAPHVDLSPCATGGKQNERKTNNSDEVHSYLALTTRPTEWGLVGL